MHFDLRIPHSNTCIHANAPLHFLCTRLMDAEIFFFYRKETLRPVCTEIRDNETCMHENEGQ